MFLHCFFFLFLVPVQFVRSVVRATPSFHVWCVLCVRFILRCCFVHAKQSEMNLFLVHFSAFYVCRSGTLLFLALNQPIVFINSAAVAAAAANRHRSAGQWTITRDIAQNGVYTSYSFTNIFAHTKTNSEQTNKRTAERTTQINESIEFPCVHTARSHSHTHAN